MVRGEKLKKTAIRTKENRNRMGEEGKILKIDA